jgi:uncharacterized protein YerC
MAEFSPFPSIAAAVAALRHADEAETFLRAMLSSEEYYHLQGRWEAFQLKRHGFSHRETAKRAGVSLQTATRAAALQRIDSSILEDVISRCGLHKRNNVQLLAIKEVNGA